MSETIFKSQTMHQLVARAKLAANSDAPAFITGENGVGKEHIARLLHFESHRKDDPFLAINCAAIPRDLVEAELFGSVKGAYTGSLQDRHGIFRSATKGTVFLDELAEMAPDVQTKLLRVLQDKKVQAVGSHTLHPVDCRVIAATNLSVKEAILTRKLRMDLYFRLAVVTLDVPPLRDRLEDIEPLLMHFLNKYKVKDKVVTLASDVVAYLKSFKWEGNVRELENAVRRASLFGGEHIRREHFELEGMEKLPAFHLPVVTGRRKTLAEVEAEMIVDALTRYNGNRDKVAAELGIGRSTLYKKMADMRNPLDSVTTSA